MSKKLYYTKTILFPLFFSHCKSGNLLKVYRYKKWPKAPIRDRLNGHKNNRISAAVQLFFYVLLAKKRNFKLKKKKLIRQFQLFLVFLQTQNRIMLIMNCNNMLNCSEIKLNSNMKKKMFYIKFIGVYIPYIIREHFFLKEGPWEWVWVRYIFYGRERKS